MSEPDFAVGEEVFYVLPSDPKHGRSQALFLRATVRSMTPQRITVVVNGHHRNVLRGSLVRRPPAGAWIK